MNKAQDAATASSATSEAVQPTYEINLDRKKLRTPARNVFQVDNPAVAFTVGAEWAAQRKEIAQSSMHLVRLKLNSV